MEWKPVEAAAKNDKGEYVVKVNGVWIPAIGAAKNDQGQYIAQFDAPAVEEPSFIAKGIGSAARGVAGMIDIVPSLGAAAYEKLGGTVDKTKFNPHATSELANDLLPAKYDGLTGAVIEGAAAGGVTGIGKKALLAAAEMGYGALSGAGAETAREMGGGGVAQFAAGMATPTIAGKLASSVGGALRGGLAVADVVANPERIAAGVFQKGAVNNKDLVARLRAASAETEGLPLTSSQALRDTGLAEQELARRSRSGAEFEPVDLRQRKAMADALSKIAQTPEIRAELVKNRGDITTPMLESIKGKVMPYNEELASLLRRSDAMGGNKQAKIIAGGEDRPFTLPVLGEGAPLSLDDAIRMNLNRPTMPDFNMGAGMEKMPTIAQNGAGILSEIRKRGGLHTSEVGDITGDTLRNSGSQVGIFNNKGQYVGDMAEQLVAEKILPPSVLQGNGGARNLSEIIRNELHPVEMDKNALNHANYMAEAPVLPGAFINGSELTAKEFAAVHDPNIAGKTITGDTLDYVRKGVNHAMKGADAPMPQLMQLKKDLSGYIENNAPDYKAGVDKFAELSQPINRLDVGQKLYDKFVPAMADIASSSPAMRGEIYKTRANSLAEALRNGDSMAQQATGFSGAKLAKILSEGDINSVRGVVNDSARISDALSRGIGKGSPTNRYAMQNQMIGQHIAEQAGIPGWMQSAASSPAVGYTAGLPFKVMHAVLGGASERLNVPIGQILDRMHADPKFAAEILDKASIPLAQKESIMQSFINPRAGGVAASLSESQKGD